MASGSGAASAPAGDLGWPWAVSAALAASAVGVALADQVRLAAYLVAATFGVTAVLRAALPDHLAGALAVRSRTTDVLVLLTAAVGTAVLAATLLIPTR
ncbi:MAG: DUF3017 domain-containing protein [Angustibacter sp.]